MASPRLTITLAAPEAASLDLLLIEQQAWSAYTGRVTTGAMVRALRTMLYGDEYRDVLDCGLINGSVVCVVDVYPRVRGLQYQFAASHGVLSERSEQEVVVSETINFSLADSVAPNYPPLSIHSAAWADAVYDVLGNEIDPPKLTIVEGGITCPAKVYGAVEVEYRTDRHSYILTISRRSGAIDNFYSAVVYGWYDGGLNWEMIDLPPGIEAFEADPDAVCGHSVTATVTDDDPNPYEQPVAANRKSVVDYCSQEIVEDSYE